MAEPKQPDTEETQISARITWHMREEVQEQCIKHGISQTAFLRSAIAKEVMRLKAAKPIL